MFLNYLVTAVRMILSSMPSTDMDIIAKADLDFS